MTLFVIIKAPGTEKEEVRLARLKGWPYAINFALAWAGKSACRLCEIDPDLAKKLYPKVSVETNL